MAFAWFIIDAVGFFTEARCSIVVQARPPVCAVANVVLDYRHEARRGSVSQDLSYGLLIQAQASGLGRPP